MKKINALKLDRDIRTLIDNGMNMIARSTKNNTGIGGYIWGLVRKKLDPDLHYYVVDVEFFVDLECELIVFDMKDNFYGGKGKEIARHRYVYAENEKVKELAYNYIERRKIDLSVIVQEEREQERKKSELSSITDELFN